MKLKLNVIEYVHKRVRKFMHKTIILALLLHAAWFLSNIVFGKSVGGHRASGAFLSATFDPDVSLSVKYVVACDRDTRRNARRPTSLREVPTLNSSCNRNWNRPTIYGIITQYQI
jgi:hypothetical protein